MNNLILNIVAFATIFSAVLVITSKNPVISILFLISTFVNAAIYLILSGIVFIGISYIIIYIGAIAVIFLFIIMMINIKLAHIIETGTQFTKNIPLAIIIGSLFLFELFNIMPFTLNDVSGINYLLEILNNLNKIIFNTKAFESLNTMFISYNPNIVDSTFINFLHIQAIGHNIYTYGAVLLIILSIILLLSMIAPIFISRKINNNK
jgi:NADH-ubiquinone oxidoreductase chain 6